MFSDIIKISINEIKDTLNFIDLDIDSLLIIEVLKEIEKRFNVNIISREF